MNNRNMGAKCAKPFPSAYQKTIEFLQNSYPKYSKGISADMYVKRVLDKICFPVKELEEL